MRLSGWRWSVRQTGRLLLEQARLDIISPPRLLQTPGSLTADGPGPQRLADSEIAGGQVRLAAPGAVVERVALVRGRLELGGAGARAEEVVVTRGPVHGILVAGDDVEIRGCVVTGHGRDGVHVTGGTGVSVSDCDLENNGGAGVANEGQDTVSANSNWWGDPAGPLGGSGDGLQGAVDASGARAIPRSGRPASITLTGSVIRLPTGDSLRFTVDARNAQGLPTPTSGFVLRPKDDLLVFPDTGDLWLAVARSPGVARVEAVYLPDETLRASAQVEIETGAPFLDWSWVDEEPEGAVAVLPFSATQLVIGEAGGSEIRFLDGDVTTVSHLESCCGDYNYLVLGGTSLDDVWAAVHLPGEKGLRFRTAHWDGESWSLFEEIEGYVSVVWARSTSDVLVVWNGGIRRWNGEAWSDERVAPGGWRCQGLPGASAGHPWVLCQEDPGASVVVLRHDGSEWQEVVLPPVPEPLCLADLVVHPSGRLLLASPFQDWATLEGGAWRSLPAPPGQTFRGWLPFGDGAFVQSYDGRAGHGLWYLGTDESWQRVWIPQDPDEGTLASPRQH